MNDMRLAERTVDTKGKPTKFSCRNVQVFYGDKHAIKDVDVDLEDKTVTAFIGPSGCGKSTFLRTMNRMNEVTPGAYTTGSVTLDGPDLYGKRVDPVGVRTTVRTVFQRATPFPTM